MKQEVEKKSLQSGVETAILKTTWIREGGLSRGMVLLLEVEDDLVTGVSELDGEKNGDRQRQK